MLAFRSYAEVSLCFHIVVPISFEKKNDGSPLKSPTDDAENLFTKSFKDCFMIVSKLSSQQKHPYSLYIS